jgi:hypothetical protein
MALLVSVPGKGGITRQVRVEKANESKPLVKRRKRRDVIKTGLQWLARDKLGGHLPTDRAVTGARAVRARFRLCCGTFTPMPREKSKWSTHEEESTEAAWRGSNNVSVLAEGGRVMLPLKRPPPSHVREIRTHGLKGGLAPAPVLGPEGK